MTALVQSQRKPAAVLRFGQNYQPIFTARCGGHTAPCHKSNSVIAAANLLPRASLPSLALASHIEHCSILTGSAQDPSVSFSTSTEDSP
jgi:hypothetical protein